MLELAARVLFPVALVIGAALLVKSYSDLGDGFSAGAVAGLGAIIQYVCLPHSHARRRVNARWSISVMAAGLLLILGFLLIPALFGSPPVSHLPTPGGSVAKLGAMELHTSLIFDLGIAAVVYGAMVSTFDRLFPHSFGGAA